jgi:hypothetical protein
MFTFDNMDSYKERDKLEAVESLNKSPARIERLILKDTPSTGGVYTLLSYLDDEVINRITINYQCIQDKISHCCPPLSPEFSNNRDVNIELFHALIRRTILELLSFCDKGRKIRTMMMELEKLYMTKQYKADFKNSDNVHQLIDATIRLIDNPTSDVFYQKYSGVLDKGRHSRKEKENQPNRVDAIRKTYIMSRKQVPPIRYDETTKTFYIETTQSLDKSLDISNYQIDLYPLFVKVLRVQNEVIPRPNNHGHYLNKLFSMMRHLSSKQWPMKGLVRSIIRMERVLEKRKIRVPDNGVTYYCAYSGIKLEPGEEVWHVRILLNNLDRHNTWHIDGKQPREPNTAPDYTSSIRAYFIKTQITSRCCLVYSPYIPPMDHVLANRNYSYNALYYTLIQLRLFLKQHNLEDYLFHHDDSINYRDSINKLTNVLSTTISSPNFKDVFLQFIFHATLYKINVSRIDVERSSQYCFCMLDIVLDFIDLLFIPQPVSLQKVQRTQVIEEEINIRDVPLLSTNKPVKKPILSDKSPLKYLLKLCDERQINRTTPMTESEKQQRLIRLETTLSMHPYLFITLFNVIYTADHTESNHNFTEIATLLKKLNFKFNL